MTFNDFVHKHNLKNKTTSSIKIYEVLEKIGLDSKVGIYLRDGDFSTQLWYSQFSSQQYCFVKDCYFDSYGCPPPIKLLNIFENKHGKCFFSEYQFQKNDSFLQVVVYMELKWQKL